MSVFNQISTAVSKIGIATNQLLTGAGTAVIMGVSRVASGGKILIIGIVNTARGVIKTTSRIGAENFHSAMKQATRRTISDKWMVVRDNENNSDMGVEMTDPSSTPLLAIEKSPSEKSIGRHIADILFAPFTTIPGWVLGFTLVPFIVHSWDSSTKFYRAPLDAVYFDKRKLTPPTLHGKLYGIIGAIFGFTVGIGVAGFSLIGRIVDQTALTTVKAWRHTVNSCVSDVKNDQAIFSKLSVDLDDTEQTEFEEVIGILPLGWATVIATTIITTAVIFTGRLLVNTVVSLGRNLIDVMNLAVSDMYTDNTKGKTYRLITMTSDPRNRIQRGFGIVGTVVGWLLGSGAAAIVFVVRVIFNSLQSFVQILSSSIQVFLKKNSKVHDFFTLKDHRDELQYGWSKQLGYLGVFPLGLFAVPVGLAIGATTRWTVETAISAGNSAIESFNLALKGAPEYKIKSPWQAQREHKDRAIGVVGYPLGSIITLPVTVPIIFVRYVITNYTTFRQVFRFIMNSQQSNVENAALDSATESNQGFIHWLKNLNSQDRRPLWVQLTTFPIAVVAFGLGSGWRVLVESTLSTVDTFYRLINGALYKSKFENQLVLIKPKRNYVERSFGAVGYSIGSVGVLPAIIIGVARWIITNGDTLNRAFIATVNSTREESKRIADPISDNRPRVIRYSTFLGGVLGVALGAVDAIGENIIESFSRQVRSYTKASLIDSGVEDKIDVYPEDTRQLLQLGLGSSGWALGTVVGGLTYFGISIVRILGNTVITAYHTAHDIVDVVFMDELPTVDSQAESRRLAAYFKLGTSYSQIPTEDVESSKKTVKPVTKRREDKRLDRAFALGMFGFIVGGVIGSFLAPLAGSMRIVINSVIIAYETALDAADKILPVELSTDPIRTSKRAQMARWLGYPFGWPIGAIVGIVVWITILVARIVVNTVTTLGVVAAAMTTLPPMSNEKYESVFDRLDAWDPRPQGHLGRKLGILGFLFGVAIGAVGYVINYAAHTLCYSFTIADSLISFAYSWAMGSPTHGLILGNVAEYERIFTKDFFQKPWFKFLALGALPVGLVVAGIVMGVRLLLWNFKMIGLGFKDTANLVLKPEDHYRSLRPRLGINRVQLHQSISLSPTVNKIAKYSVGSPGFLLGGSVAMCTIVPIYGAYRFLEENINSYLYLSKSLLNVGLEAPYFEGVAADERRWYLKTSGIFGYGLAACTTGLVPVASFIVKLTLATLAIASSLIIAPKKLHRILMNPRFTKNLKDDEQAYREIYSALQGGELPVGQQIQKNPNATGGKGAWDFFRKALMFNMNTLTEDILEAKLDAKRRSVVFDDKKQREIKQNHYGSFFFKTTLRRQFNNSIDRQFKQVNNYIDMHVSGSEGVTPSLEDDTNFSAQALFNYKWSA